MHVACFMWAWTRVEVVYRIEMDKATQNWDKAQSEEHGQGMEGKAASMARACAPRLNVPEFKS